MQGTTVVAPVNVFLAWIWARRKWGQVGARHAAAAAKSLQSCLTLSDPMDYSPPGSSTHGIFQARVLEWGAIAFSEQGNLGESIVLASQLCLCLALATMPSLEHLER